MTNLIDFMIFVTNDAQGSNLTWNVCFTDGETRSGTLRHLGGSAYVVSGNTDYYFSSNQVVRLYATSDD